MATFGEMIVEPIPAALEVWPEGNPIILYIVLRVGKVRDHPIAKAWVNVNRRVCAFQVTVNPAEIADKAVWS